MDHTGTHQRTVLTLRMGFRSLAGACLGLALAASACAAGAGDDETSSEALSAADPAAGWRFLANGPYIGCGIPKTVFDQLQTGLDIPILGHVGRGLLDAIFPVLDGAETTSSQVPGREGDNENLSYRFTAFKTARGNEVVNFTCLSCHTGVIEGKAIVGLGDTISDYTGDLGFASKTLETVTRFVGSDEDRTEAGIFAQRFGAIAPYVRTSTVGVNSAVNLTYALIAHRDPRTLAWSDEALMPPPPEESLPYDVPAWWHMKHRSTAFMSAELKFHTGTLALASLLGTETVAQKRAWDNDFRNVEAFIRSVEAPPYPRAVNRALADQGSVVYERACASCHGTYGANAAYKEAVYDVGTDPEAAKQELQESDRFYEWMNASPYNSAPDRRMQAFSSPAKLGYLAPPLEGVWATAPYFHNGSVPSMEAVLDSSKRPTSWTRFGQRGRYDVENMAIGHVKALGKHTSFMPSKFVYDTRDTGYGNEGHTYGDALTDVERTAVIEYLKTL